MGRHLNAAVKDGLVTMSEKMSTRDISWVTNIPERTLYRVLADPYQHNDAHVETRGRHRALTVHAVNVRTSAGIHSTAIWLTLGSFLIGQMDKPNDNLAPCHESGAVPLSLSSTTQRL